MLVLAGTVQFGYTFYLYNRLLMAVGEGARYAAQRSFRAATPDDVRQGADAIRNMVVYGDPQPAAGARPLVPGLNHDNIEVKWDYKKTGEPEFVNVAVRNFTVGSFLRTFTFDQRPVVQFPFVGRYAPGEREP